MWPRPRPSLGFFLLVSVRDDVAEGLVVDVAGRVDGSESEGLFHLQVYEDDDYDLRGQFESQWKVEKGYKPHLRWIYQPGSSATAWTWIINMGKDLTIYGFMENMNIWTTCKIMTKVYLTHPCWQNPSRWGRTVWRQQVWCLQGRSLGGEQKHRRQASKYIFLLSNICLISICLSIPHRWVSPQTEWGTRWSWWALSPHSASRPVPHLWHSASLENKCTIYIFYLYTYTYTN